MLTIAAVCLVITALLAHLNYRFIKMPSTIGVMAAALVFSLALVGLDALGVAHALREFEASLLRSIDFSDVPMQGMLSLLLFAGALHIDLSELKAYHWQVGRLAVLGTLLSTLVLGSGKWWALPLVGAALGGPAFAAGLLPAVWRADLTHRPDCRHGHPQIRRCAQGAGAGDRK